MINNLQDFKPKKDVYGCCQGVAVAETLNCTLPANIRFVKYNYKEVRQHA